MGAFADSLFEVLMSWVRALVNSIWALFASEDMTALEFLGKNWILIVIVIIAAGLFVDWLIWLIRWRPYTLWAQRIRRLLRIGAPQEDDEEESLEADDSVYARPVPQMKDDDDLADDGELEDDDWLPEPPEPEIEAQSEPQEAQEAIRRASEVPDRELGAYPGRLYDENAKPVVQAPAAEGTRRFAAIHHEGPGAAEVSRRRAEIDAWQQQMQDEARAQREQRMAQLRREEEARLAEEERLAEEARFAEQARLEQEEYARRLEEYERQKAQYEREMEQYRKDLAAYEAAVAAQKADAEAAREISPEQGASRTRTRRRQRENGSEDQEALAGPVNQLPDTPDWPQVDKAYSEVKKTAGAGRRATKQNGLIGRMAHLIEPEHEEIVGVNALPPRVDMHEAYKPAAKPENPSVRRKP